MHAMPTARDFFRASLYPPGPFICIYSETSPEFFLSAVVNTGSCLGPQNKGGHPACRCRQLMQVLVLSRGKLIGFKTCVIVFLGWHFELWICFCTFRERLVCSVKYEVSCVVDVILAFRERLLCSVI